MTVARRAAPMQVLVILLVAGAILLVLGVALAMRGGWQVYLPANLTDADAAAAGTLLRVKSFGLIATLIAALPLIGGLWLAALGFGWPLGRLLLAPRQAPEASQFPSLVAQAGIGMAVLLQLNWLLAWGGGLNAFTAWLLIATGVALAVLQFTLWYRREQPEELEPPYLPWTILLPVPAIGLLLVACMCPPGTLWQIEARAYDVISYHLQLPHEWLELGQASVLHHNVYSYLPNLVESSYMLIGAIKGSMYSGIYFTHLFHASAGLYAATALACLAARGGGVAGAAAGGVMMLVLPWTIITGSLAYDEMFVLAFGACALLVIFEPSSKHGRQAAAAGLLVGAATLSKLTGGMMVAVPVGVLLLLRLHYDRADAQRPSWRQALSSAAVAAAVGAAMLAPWMTRNALDSGNPVFPFAARRLGMGHWTEQLVDRWDRGHRADATLASVMGASVGTELGSVDKFKARFKLLGQQWLFNTGYGAPFGSQRTEHEAQNVAHFNREWGLPLLWLVVAAAGGLAFGHQPTRHLAISMLVLLGLQLLFWMTLTHLQSRFLIPTLLPACALLGIGFGRLELSSSRQVRWTLPAIAVLLTVTFTSISFGVFYRQIFGQYHEDRFAPAAPWQIMDTLPADVGLDRPDAERGAGEVQINALLPKDSKVLLVADNTRLLYIRHPMIYYSAFDANPLGELIRRHRSDPDAVTAALRQQGITHVWIHWEELARLAGTYGIDLDANQEQLQLLIASGWAKQWSHPNDVASLYQLP
jgi:hypothetical protein